MQKQIKILINSKTDSFGTKTIIFVAEDGKLYIDSRDEGSHSEIEIGSVTYSAQPHNSNNCTL